MAFFNTVRGWFRWGGNALAEARGEQYAPPSGALVPGLGVINADSAMQISTVWNCIERRANVVASLPLFVYRVDNAGQKQLARGTLLYQLLHDSPNARMTPFEFWRAMMMNHDLRGNAYARIDRNGRGEAVALWPMPADQVKHVVMEDGTGVYEYRIGNDLAILSEQSVLHLKNLGNGTTGLPKLDFMGATASEAANAQRQANGMFSNGGKPTGILMVDSLLKEEQRERLRANMALLSNGSTDRLFVLEANMKYQPISLTAEQMQLLETRKFTIEEICRWFDVPPVLAHHANVTTWGSGIEQIIDGWHKLSVRPMLVNIDQAVKKRVLTNEQRASMHAEFSHDALLRGNIKDRYEVYTKGIQGGVLKPNEARQLENLPPVDGGDSLMVQSQMVPISQLGQQAGNGVRNGNENPDA
jgi:HK97 family phage portal protein